MKKEIIYGLGTYLLITILIWMYFGWNDVVFIMLLSISWIPVYFVYYIGTSFGTYIGSQYRKLKNRYLDWRMAHYIKEFENEDKKRK